MSWDEIVPKLGNRVDSLGRRIQDDSLKYNAENASGVGIEVRVSRQYDRKGLSNGRDCEWCLDRVCENMPYKEAYNLGVFERHDGCGCIIEYVARKSKRINKVYQEAKSGPNDWLSEEEFLKRVNHGVGGRILTPQERNINAAIEMQIRDRKSRTLANAIVDNHDALKYYTPARMKRRLERAGYTIETLSKSLHDFNDKTFEEGGGYIIHFAENAVFQYHPAGGEHGIEYWKINNGERGKHWYDREGIEHFFGKKRRRLV